MYCARKSKIRTSKETTLMNQNTAPCLRLRQGVMSAGKVLVDRLEKFWRAQFQWSDDGHQGQRQDDTPFVWPQVFQQAAHQVRVVRFAERFFFVHVAHARSSSSSSNCLRYKSA